MSKTSGGNFIVFVTSFLAVVFLICSDYGVANNVQTNIQNNGGNEDDNFLSWGKLIKNKEILEEVNMSMDKVQEDDTMVVMKGKEKMQQRRNLRPQLTSRLSVFPSMTSSSSSTTLSSLLSRKMRDVDTTNTKNFFYSEEENNNNPQNERNEVNNNNNTRSRFRRLQFFRRSNPTFFYGLSRMQDGTVGWALGKPAQKSFLPPLPWADTGGQDFLVQYNMNPKFPWWLSNMQNVQVAGF